jgi:hypothetical protein
MAIGAMEASAMHLILVGLLVIHGLIHLVGFVKGFGLAPIEPLTLAISRPWGLVWLLAAVLMLAAAGARLAGLGAWWMVAAAALVSSQVLVVAFWADAKFATLANVLVALAVIVGIGAWRFDGASARSVRGLLERVADGPSSPLLAAELAGLPPIVRAWVTRSGAVGRARPRVVHVRQRGEMQTAKDGRWMPFRAEQWFTPTAPGFVWVADVTAAPGVHMAGRDAYVDGRGSMRIELLALVPVVDARGPRLDQGALVRYLAEVIWFPAHATGLRWEAIDATSARATLVDGETTASGVYTFTPDGDLLRFEARRYREETLEDWLVEIDPDGHGELGGLRLPLRASVSWKLAGGTWTWLRLEVVGLDEDATVPSHFPSPGA